jgi:hypothetical protein
MKSKRWGRTSSWYAVAFVLPMMIMMVTPALSATGWYNWYNSANTTMYWMYNGNWRLAYTYGAGQWWDCTQLGGKDNWNTVGSAGQSPDFRGNASIGSYLPIGNGWYYAYDTRSDCGYWANSSGNFRFGYYCGLGQWYDQNFNQWNQIGASGVQSPFVGDGSLHDMKNNWSYEYLTSNDTGYWSAGGTWRLGYGYTPGVWWDCSDTWRPLSATGVSSAFLGNAANGAYCYLNNGWYYGYDVNKSEGFWAASNGQFRFAYGYSGRVWYDHGGNLDQWLILGPLGLSSDFIGNGNWHTFDSIWSYKYVNGVGYLKGSVSTWIPTQTGGGSWSSSPTQFTCDYTSQALGFLVGGGESVTLYDYNGGTSYNCKYMNWVYDSRGKEARAASVFYTGNVTHDVSSWFTWIAPPISGPITRTETWDFLNNDWANRYNHEVRAFANNGWVVQREQGDYGDCGIIASIDAFEAATGIYVGWTLNWLMIAVNHGWATGSVADPAHYGSSTVQGNSSLMAYMGTELSRPVTTSAGTYSISDLQTYLSQGYKVDVGLQLSYISEFGTSGGHAVDLLGFTYYNGAYYAQITNHWNIQSNTTQTTGMDPKYAYPITLIPYSEFVNAYNAQGGSAAIVR